jgi:methylated-DNA-protein-cysteine methyltransferase-like protein
MRDPEIKQENGFFRQVYQIVARIPPGTVVSYGQIARMLGRPRAAREVGRAMRFCPEELPWHRVLMANGAVLGGEGTAIRLARLQEEDYTFLPGGRVDMAAHQWDGSFPGDEE